ncbi:MAG: GAF domain-containing protein, partial [Calditrichaeota bacterium]
NKVLNTIIDSLKEVVPYDAAVIFLINEKTCEIEQEVSRGYNPDFIQKLHLKVGQGLSGWVAKTGQPILVPDVRKDKRYVVADPQTLSEIAVPLMRGKKIIGVFNVESKKVNAYTWQDVELLKTFASQATITIENARLFKEALHKRYLEKELEVAREIQKALLPKRLPKVKRFAFAALNVPSEQVGGDFYDAIKLADGTVSLAIADVSGKGTPGAILMSNLSATFRSQVRRDLPPDVILERVNKLFCETITSGSFATFFYGKLNPRTKSFEYANAGHNPPLLIRSDGSMEFLKKGGLIMGFLPRVEYNREEVQLAPGDLLIMYTDGLTEAENKKGQLFGTERLIKVVKKHTKLPPTVVKRKIFQELKKFLKGSPLSDDVTLLLVKAV